jgi:hypothetical protein
LVALLIPTTAQANSEEANNDVIETITVSTKVEDHSEGTWLVWSGANGEEDWIDLEGNQISFEIFYQPGVDIFTFYFMVDGVRYGPENDMQYPWTIYDVDEYDNPLWNVFYENENRFYVYAPQIHTSVQYSFSLFFADNIIYMSFKTKTHHQDYIENAYDFIADGIYYSIIDDGQMNKVSVTYEGTAYHFINMGDLGEQSYSEIISYYSGDICIPVTVFYDGVTYSVTSISDYAFYNCNELTTVTIPNTITSIGNSAFSGCARLNHVFSYIADPSLIEMDYGVFFRDVDNYANRTLHVPAGSLAAYQADDRWSQYFGNIVEITNKIGDINGDGLANVADVTALIQLILNN